MKLSWFIIFTVVCCRLEITIYKTIFLFCFRDFHCCMLFMEEKFYLNVPTLAYHTHHTPSKNKLTISNMLLQLGYEATRTKTRSIHNTFFEILPKTHRMLGVHTSVSIALTTLKTIKYANTIENDAISSSAHAKNPTCRCAWRIRFQKPPFSLSTLTIGLRFKMSLFKMARVLKCMLFRSF